MKTKKEIIDHYHHKMNNNPHNWIDVATSAVRSAERYGHITRPNSCSQCYNKKGDAILGFGGLARIESHHHNYNFPLRVAWLCQPCHNKIHKKTKSVKYRFNKLNYNYVKQ